MKRFVILFLLLGMTVPFVLLTDLYPFFRFGMFAEPVQRSVQTELFLLRYADRQGRWHWVQPEEVGLLSLAYLLRNYYYRGETQVLLQRIHPLHPQKEQIREWQLLRTVSAAKQYTPDTTRVGQWKTAY